MVSSTSEVQELMMAAEVLSAKIERMSKMMKTTEAAARQTKAETTRQAKEVAEQKKEVEKFVRYKEGAKRYQMSQSKFEQLAKEANACYKINKIVLVNTEILDQYLETFRVITEF